MERIILQSATIDEDPPIGQRHHSIAKHIPGYRSGGDRVSLRIPDSSLVIRIACNIAGTRNNKNFTRVKKCDVHRVDRHRSRQC